MDELNVQTLMTLLPGIPPEQAGNRCGDQLDLAGDGGGSGRHDSRQSCTAEAENQHPLI